MQTKTQTPALLTTAVLLLSGCSGYVDLDVTLFDHIDLATQLENHGMDDLPSGGGSKTILRRAEIDLTEDVSDTISGAIDEVFIHELTWRVPENAMNAELRDVTVYIGPFDAQEVTSTDVVELATIDSIKPGEIVDTQRLPATATGILALEKRLLDFKLALFIEAKVPLDETSPDPEGIGLIEIDVKASVHKN